jgi:hypothetical protein
MTGARSTADVPALGVPSTSTGPSAGATLRRAALPLPRLVAPHRGRTVYEVAAMDNRGRITYTRVQRALGWGANAPLDIRERAGLILVTADRGGRFSVSNDGQLRLSPTVRRWCGLVPGDRVLLTARDRTGGGIDSVGA